MKKTSILKFLLVIVVINVFITLLTMLIYNNQLHVLLKSLNQDYANLMVVVVTIVYTVFNSLAFFEMYKQRKREESPELTLIFTKSDNLINIQMKNISRVPAYDVKFIEFPNVKLFTNNNEEFYDIKKQEIIRKGINYMGPSQIYNVFFDLPDAKHENKESSSVETDVEYTIDFRVEYLDKRGQKYELKVSTLLSTLKFVGEDALGKIGDALKEIAEEKLLEPNRYNR
ncbi:hypothetical protein ACER0A_002110 [Haloimpatiens sp. FM7315]|uniref:hypothetical protein n=1 Tax=Haloimpatiens sp. FM7315 TaxID=3298609 RepID=UPI0035A3384E